MNWTNELWSDTATVVTPESLRVTIPVARRSERIRTRQFTNDYETGDTEMEQLTRCMEQLAETQRRQLELLEQGNGGARRQRDHGQVTNLSPYSEKEDIQDFLTAFERAMGLNQIDEREWPSQLLKVLTGKARAAYVEVDPRAGYPAIKEAILRRFDVTPEASRVRLRELRYDPQQDPGDMLVTLETLARRWIIPTEEFEEDEDPERRDDIIVDRVVREQLLNMLPREKREWLLQQDLRSSRDIVQRLREYRLIQRENGPKRGLPKEDSQSRVFKPAQSNARNTERNNPGTSQSSGLLVRGSATSESLNRMKDKTCYKCGRKGHLMRNCKQEVFGCIEGPNYTPTLYTCCGKVNGRAVSDMRLDTQCSRTVIRRELVDPGCVKQSIVSLCVASGEVVQCPLADVSIELDGIVYDLEVAVYDALPAEVLLGRDVALGKHLWRLMPEHEKREILTQEREQPIGEPEEALAVTRSQTRREREKNEAVPEEEALRHSNGVEDTPPISISVDGELSREFPFSDDLFLAPPEGKDTEQTGPSNPTSTRRTCTNQSLLDEQQTDEAIQAWRARGGSEVVSRNGILFRLWRPRGTENVEYEQLLLPKPYRTQVLQVAHDIPFSGHLGKDKTTQRILRRFYWPTVYRDVADYVSSCETCQRTAKLRKHKAPLQPLPIMGEPFDRVAMDIVGPLPRTRKGNEYILVLSDYATRYPEAIPLRRFTAQTVAERLIEVFARYGIPREILTDQGTNFTSQLLKELYQLLGVTAIRTTPYHPQTNGLVERFNRTLKSMLTRVLSEDKREWDELVPYVLFAYREVPQASTGFSPFELVMGRDVRGPLDVLQEGWTSTRAKDDSIAEYVTRVKERMQLAKEVVKENMLQAQQTQKLWYDKKARELQLKPGDKVLVLLPTSTHKLTAQWKGPYIVKQAVGKVNFEIVMPERRRPNVVFHINLLRKWKERSPTEEGTAFHIEEADDPDSGETAMPEWKPPNSMDDLQVGTELTSNQQEEVRRLLRGFPEVVSARPGRTQLVCHRIPTTSTPIHQPPYRIPRAYYSEVVKELEEMLEAGVIEPSKSEWAFPIVVVKKKDGRIRICIDYRKLNAVTQGDAYPMPRIDDILDNLGQSQYITTLDLAKGYWQVPVSPEDREKTAFASPLGLFHFRVMPFGLSGAPATFQRLMDQVVRGLPFTNAYLDDLVVYSGTWDEHLTHVGTVMERLKEAGLVIQLKKCQFGMRECTYLGHSIGRGVTKPEGNKVKDILNYPVPRTKKAVRSYLGLTGYYRRFIKNYATTAKPLTDLTKKALPEKVTWTSECQLAFESLKKALTSQPVMRNPDFEKEFVLQTDASGYGVGAVLSQLDEEGRDHAIAYFSRKLLPREMKYATVEQECLAIKLAVQAFSVYLLGRKFKVQTDHRALAWLNKAKESNARLTRWSLSLQPYDFVIEHRRGQANANADALSRMEMEAPQKKEGKNVKVEARVTRPSRSISNYSVSRDPASRDPLGGAAIKAARQTTGRTEPPPIVTSCTTYKNKTRSPVSSARP